MKNDSNITLTKNSLRNLLSRLTEEHEYSTISGLNFEDFFEALQQTNEWKQILENQRLREIIQIEISKVKIEEDRLREILQECREDNDEYGAVGYSNQVSQQMVIGEKLQSILKESQS